VDSLDPALFDSDEMRAVLAARDIGTLYRLLRRLGVSQRHIAQLTDQSQSEVSEIIRGRQVRDVRVLERIADGLGIPRAWLDVSCGEEVPDPSSAEEVKRRALLAATSAAALGEVLVGLGEPIELALPNGQALPSQLSMSHVHAARAVTERLRGVARYYGGQAGLFGAATTIYTPWTQVPGPGVIKTQLAAVLAADDPRLPTLTSPAEPAVRDRLRPLMNGTDEATRCLAEANEEWGAPRCLRARGWGFRDRRGAPGSRLA
jgi:transcriptional regulator with XRE-family HTH domain